MRLGTLATAAGPRAVALRGDRLVELPGTLRELLGAGTAAIAEAISAASVSHPHQPDRLLAAVPDPGKILCIGRNYADHAAELGHRVNARPEVFMRARTSLAAPFGPIERPAASAAMDWEVELAVVIGRGGRHIPESEALAHVAGYCAFNDVSIRDFQSHGSQFTPGKNFDRTGPLGPFVVTADEVPDPHALDLSCAVRLADGTVVERQRSSTGLMVHRIPALLAYVSTWTTLEPGDLLATGTPAGVGAGRDPQVWLLPGQTLISRIEGVGEMANRVVDEVPASA